MLIIAGPVLLGSLIAALLSGCCQRGSDSTPVVEEQVEQPNTPAPKPKTKEQLEEAERLKADQLRSMREIPGFLEWVAKHRGNPPASIGGDRLDCYGPGDDEAGWEPDAPPGLRW